MLAVFTPLYSVAQLTDIKPKWIKEPPEAHNGSYEFKVFKVQSPSAREAKRALPDEAAYYIERSYSVKGATVELTDVHQHYVNGNLSSTTTTHLQEVVHTEMDKVSIELRVVDEYRDGNDNYFLCTIPNPNSRYVHYDPVVVTNKYGAKGLMSIVPGVGQFYKRHYLKGGLILGGSTALAAGIIFTHMTYKDYRKKLTYTDNVYAAMIYNKRSDHFKLARNICIGALGALYIYNLIDACVTPGARYVKFVKSDRYGNTYALAPSVSGDGAPMLAASITF